MMSTPNPQPSRSLKQLLSAWKTAVAGTNHPHPPRYDGPDVTITQLTEDTRQLQPGGCFVARVRTRGDGTLWSDGHTWIGKAVELGARVIVGQRPFSDLDTPIPNDVVYLGVPNTAVAVAWLAAAWHGFPSKDLVVIGITGTDGKSSTAQILHTVMQTAGLRTGLLSTIRAVIGDAEEPLALHVTTPEAPVVQQYLRRMVDAGLTHCILETTSHALAQQRVTAVAYDVAVVTNITHEHLDYHGSWEAYFAAKASLFEKLAQEEWRLQGNNEQKQRLVRTAVLNRDDSSYERLSQIPTPCTVTYAIRQNADVVAANVRFAPAETSFDLQLKTDASPPLFVTSPLVGAFNIYNMLAAAAAAAVLGILPAQVQQGLAAVTAISGRMERIHRGQPFQVIVDFAHTPISLEKAIGVARQMIRKNGRIITVFGSAGQRDVAKRRLMAQVSARDADLTVLTAEDPRTESLDDILDLMAQGCRSQSGAEGETFWRISDRGRAIYFALTLARPDDLVLICGKGHEQSMCFGAVEYPWDDREATRKALDAFLRGDPMPDLGLPTYANSDVQQY